MDLLSDNAEIEANENKMFDLDPDYQQRMENNGLGFFMEEYICVYGYCPVCNQPTLKKYQQTNIPVVILMDIYLILNKYIPVLSFSHLYYPFPCVNEQVHQIFLIQQ